MITPQNLAHLSQTKFYDKSWKGACWGKAIGLDYSYVTTSLIISVGEYP